MTQHQSLHARDQCIDIPPLHSNAEWTRIANLLQPSSQHLSASFSPTMRSGIREIVHALGKIEIPNGQPASEVGRETSPRGSKPRTDGHAIVRFYGGTNFEGPHFCVRARALALGAIIK